MVTAQTDARQADVARILADVGPFASRRKRPALAVLVRLPARHEPPIQRPHYVVDTSGETGPAAAGIAKELLRP